MIYVPDEMRGVLDLVLRGLDPRLTDDQRTDAMLAALEEAPEFVTGVLSSMVETTNRRVEQLRGLPPGTLVDRMRQQHLPPRDVLGYAMHDAAPGEEIQVRMTNPESPSWGEAPAPVPIFKREGLPQYLAQAPSGQVAPVAEPRPADPVQRRGTGPNGEWTVADAAIAAEQARRARQAADLGLTTPPVGGRDQTGGTAVSGDLRAVSDGPAETGVQPNPDPRVQALLRGLEERRQDEAAIELADPDRPETMGRAMQAALDPAEVTTPAAGGPYGVNLPTEPPACGAETPTGPCALRAGHPELPVPGTFQGHMSANWSNGE